MLKKLRIKFICINMATVAVLLAVIFGLILHFTGVNLEAESLRRLQAISARPQDRPGFLHPDMMESYFPYWLVCYDPHGQIVSSGGTMYMDEDLLESLLQSVQAEDAALGVVGKYRYYTDRTPRGTTVILTSIYEEQLTIHNLMRLCLLIGFISFLILFGISFWLSKWAIGPVAKAWEQQKQFVSDASHELKTPLAVITTNAELLHAGDLDAGQSAQATGSILSMSRQMRTLVEGLLELARADNGAVKAAFAPVDLSRTAENAVLPFEPMYFEQGLVLETAIASGIRLTGSEAYLRQVIDILLDNALKYTSPGGTVRLELAGHGSHCLLWVANPGDPISKADLTNIFKRFYRVDKARSRDGSFGLGLAIADRIVAEHGGRIWAESENGVNTFFVQLPI